MRAAALLTVLLILGDATAELEAASLEIHQANLPVFESADEVFYRLPSLLVSRRGTVLAACQKRKGGRGDWAESALVLKRSTDGGRTWGPEQTLYERPGYCAFNGNLVENRQTGEVLATFIAFPTQAGPGWFSKTWIPAGGGFDLARSRDDGRTWSAAEHHIPGTNAEGWQGGAAYNNNHGVQLMRGPHAGRLVLGARVFKKGVCEDRAKGGVIYSDDHGKTWRVGGAGFADQGPINGEVALCETSTGEVYVNYRNRQAARPFRLYSRSRDGGASFYQEGVEKNLPVHECNAGLVSFSPAGLQKPLLLFTCPLESSRRKLICCISDDDGQSWSRSEPISEHGGYSDVGVLADGTVLVLYEKTQAAGLCLARFHLTETASRDDSGPGK